MEKVWIKEERRGDFLIWGVVWSVGECLHVSFFFSSDIRVFVFINENWRFLLSDFPHNEGQEKELSHTCEDLSGFVFLNQFQLYICVNGGKRSTFLYQ